MTKATEIANRLNSLVEKTEEVTFKKDVEGLDFITRKKIKIPKGTYELIGPDEEEPKVYTVISKPRSSDMYLVPNENMPNVSYS